MNIGIVIAVAEELSSFLNSKYDVITTKEGARTVYTIAVGNNNVYAKQHKKF